MCHARRVNDQYHCERCGYQWDVTDQDAPACRSEHDVAIEQIKDVFKCHGLDYSAAARRIPS